MWRYKIAKYLVRYNNTWIAERDNAIPSLLPPTKELLRKIELEVDASLESKKFTTSTFYEFEDFYITLSEELSKEWQELLFEKWDEEGRLKGALCLMYLSFFARKPSTLGEG